MTHLLDKQFSKTKTFLISAIFGVYLNEHHWAFWLIVQGMKGVVKGGQLLTNRRSNSRHDNDILLAPAHCPSTLIHCEGVKGASRETQVRE